MRTPAVRFHVLGSIAVVTAALAAAVPARGNPPPAWTVTDVQRAEKNPASPTGESTARGRALYTKNCHACHGATGDGKGPVATRLGFSAGDLTGGDEMAKKTDGELFWKIVLGRDPMPAFRKEKGLSDPQIWDVVNYVRTLTTK